MARWIDVSRPPRQRSHHGAAGGFGIDYGPPLASQGLLSRLLVVKPERRPVHGCDEGRSRRLLITLKNIIVFDEADGETAAAEDGKANDLEPRSLPLSAEAIVKGPNLSSMSRNQ